MRFSILIFLVAAASVVKCAPVEPRLQSGLQDLFQEPQEQPLSAANLLGSFVRFLLTDEVPSDLLSVASRFLGGGQVVERDPPLVEYQNGVARGAQLLRSLLAGDGGVQDEVRVDPRVLNYDQEINRRNQLSRVARIFSSILLR